VNDESFLKGFGDEPIHMFQFKETYSISTYLYCFIAGPYQIITSDREEIKSYKYPLRLQCRKSLAKYLEKSKEELFKVSKNGIDWYEEFFSTPFPFDKLDQAFVPDYEMGAMENVGMVVYRDDYVERDELFSKTKKDNIVITFLHEISHMWFGNYVTMKWWDDLWLNESFANFVSFICQDEAPGMDDYTNAWGLFLNQSFWGLATDQKNTTHPIACEVIHTDSARDIFDGISYGKGASWLNQTFFLFGREVFKKGIASYFKEFAYSNSTLDDFVRHLDDASKELKIERNYADWADTWLKAAGCNQIWHDIVEEDGKIKKFTVNQRVWQHGEGNKLRV